MKVTLQFNLPEEEQDFLLATKAGAMSAALWEIGQEIFRPARKHGYSDTQIQELITKLDGLVEKPQEFTLDGPARDATDLIGLLEQRFYQILQDHEVSLD